METSNKEKQDFMGSWGVYQIRRIVLFTPAAVVEDTRLSAQGKILFIVINSLSKNKGFCFISNENLSPKVALKTTMLKVYLKELKENQLIKIVLQPASQYPRKIYINFSGLMERYPKLPIKIPASARLSAKARRIMKNV